MNVLVCEYSAVIRYFSFVSMTSEISLLLLRFLRYLLCRVQVVEGVSALHAAKLVHCDIKPDNIFIAANDEFQPFGVCARIGDMDTCRSLRNARGSKSSSRVQSYETGTHSALESYLFWRASGRDTSIFFPHQSKCRQAATRSAAGGHVSSTY